MKSTQSSKYLERFLYESSLMKISCISKRIQEIINPDFVPEEKLEYHVNIRSISLTIITIKPMYSVAIFIIKFWFISF